MSSENQITEPDLSEFFERFAKILDKPDIKTFEWSGNGKYVAVHLQLYQDELTSQQEELAVFSGQKELNSLCTFLYSQGFKKISRRSRKDTLVLLHPQFHCQPTNQSGDQTQANQCGDQTQANQSGDQTQANQMGTRKKRRCSDLAISPSNRGQLVKRQKTDHSHPQAPEHILFFPVPDIPELRRSVRDLYQYINLDFH